MSNDMQNKPTASKPVVIPTKFGSELILKDVIAKNYMRQIQNYFGDDKKAMAFLSAVVAATQRLPELLNCTAPSVINSFMTMAQLGFMPSGVSGEAYVLPYKNKGVLEAQFQLGYQGLVTLFYRAGAIEIVADVVRKNDFFEVENKKITHRPDHFSDRGEAIGAYVIVRLGSGGEVSEVMSAKDILAMGKKFSKSFGGDFSPWNENNDPQLWMWKKTVLKQVAKLVPKNETIVNAIAEDNRDSIISDRMEAAQKESSGIAMGNLLKDEKTKQDKVGAEDQSTHGATNAEGDQSTVEGEAAIDADKN